MEHQSQMSFSPRSLLLPSSVHHSAFPGLHFIPSCLSLTHFSQEAHASPERSTSPGGDLALTLWKGTVARARREAWLSFGEPSPQGTAEVGMGAGGPLPADDDPPQPFSLVLRFSCPGCLGPASSHQTVRTRPFMGSFAPCHPPSLL